MAYAISEEDAAKAPKVADGEDTYVKQLFLKGTKYYLYVHRFDNSLDQLLELLLSNFCFNQDFLL